MTRPDSVDDWNDGHTYYDGFCDSECDVCNPPPPSRREMLADGTRDLCRAAWRRLSRPFRRAGGRMLRDDQSFALWRWQDIVIDGELYLRKLYLWRTPWQQTSVHWILRPDAGRDPHDHPRSFASILLSGGYLEQRPSSLVDARAWAEDLGYRIDRALRGGWFRVQCEGTRSYWKRLCRSDWRNASSVAFRRAEDAHRIEMVSPGTVTLVIWGRQRRPWGFLTQRGWVSWREYTGTPPAAPRRTLTQKLKDWWSR